MEPRQVARHLSFAGATPGQSFSQRAKALSGSAEDVEHRSGIPTSSDSNTPIAVVLRLRPLELGSDLRAKEIAITQHPSQEGVVHVRPGNPALQPAAIKKAGKATFKFSKVFPEQTTQREMFTQTTLPLVTGLFEKKSAVVLAYGQTGSGKTWTIQGSKSEPGLLPRALYVVLESIASTKRNQQVNQNVISADVQKLTGLERESAGAENISAEGKLNDRSVESDLKEEGNTLDIDTSIEYEVTGSYLEIYNEQCYDLFVLPPRLSDMGFADTSEPEEIALKEDLCLPSRSKAARKRPLRRQPLKLKEDGNGDIYADGQKEVKINSLADARALLRFGQQNRSVAHTNANNRSSRSHAIFTITLKQSKTEHQSNGKAAITTHSSRLAFLDLAGSERSSRTNNTGQRLREAAQINKSLMNLGRCLNELRNNQLAALAGDPSRKKLVPYRQSRLTRLLQPSLESGAAVIIVNLSQSIKDADETIHTLRSAAIAKDLTVQAERKRPRPVSAKVEAQVQQLTRRALPPRAAALKVRKIANENCDPRSARSNSVKDERDIQIAELKKQAAILRMELEEEKINHKEAEKARYEREEELIEAIEVLQDRLAEKETEMAKREIEMTKKEIEIREMVAAETEAIMEEMEKRHEEELARGERKRITAERRYSLITKTARKKMARAAGGRVSMAVFDDYYCDYEDEEYPLD